MNEVFTTKGITLKDQSPLQPVGEETEKESTGELSSQGPSKAQITRLKKLSDIAARIDAGKSREDIFGIVRQEAKQIFRYEIALIGMLNQSKTHYSITTLSPVAEATELNHKVFSLEEGMLGWVMKNHSSIVVEIASGPAYNQAIEGKMEEFGVRSLLIVPLRIGNEVIGSIGFASTQSNEYNNEDISIAQIFAISLASSVNHVTLLDDTLKRMTQIDLIYEVARQIRTQLVLEDLLNVAASAIQKRFHYFDVTIFLISENSAELVLESHSGSFVDFLPHGYRQPVTQGILGWVATNGRRELVSDVTQDPRYIVYSYHNTRSELAVPIKVEDVVVGVLNIEDTKFHAFDETDAVVLETLCDQLGAAIKNAKLFEKVRDANMKLTELDKMKSEFLGIVSHDFRSPLSSIILAGKSLLRKENVQADSHLKEYIKLMVDQAVRLNQLAEDTLSITKIESGSLSYYFKIVNIERLIQDSITLVRPSARHSLEYKIHPDAIFIKGDQPKLRQVIQNLVSNAVKYSPRGGKVNIIVDDYLPNEILISVTDEGIGIPPGQVDKLFQKFSRVDIGEARDIKGSGLGLWICKEIVVAHGGRIWVESNQGTGSVFKFTLKKAH